MVAAATTTYGGVDILVNNAALMAELKSQSAVDVPLADWNRIFDVNLTGALICTQAVVPEMRKRGGGKIVNQVSGGAFPAQSIYGISKLRSEEHTSELQSLMRISYAVFCLQ